TRRSTQEGPKFHSGYLRRVTSGELTPAEIRRIGFPWSSQMVERSRRSSGATIEACRGALEGGIAVNLAGGYARRIEDTVDIHFNTVCIAAEFSRRRIVSSVSAPV
ncbi:MAG: hypothetical protein ACREUQ_15360, partial [Burkholderiales bacterium]